MSSEIVDNCPRCGAQEITFDIHADLLVALSYGWQSHHEIFAICRRCLKPSIFRVSLRDIDFKGKFNLRDSIAGLKSPASHIFNVDRLVTQRDLAGSAAPPFVSDPIKAVFEEGTASLSASCFNAAGAMFRLTLDLVTKSLLPTGEELANHASPPNRNQLEKLAFRLDWLFENAVIPADLKALAMAVRHDGNDAAHDGTLTREDAEDLNDFAEALLERIYTEPGKLQIAEARRLARRSATS